MKKAVDWKLAGGFSALLFLIVAIGLMGILQIQSLSKTVDALGRRYFPIQNAALQMRINNSLYAMGIRNYIFWRSAKYLEAARSAANQEAINSALGAFERSLATYSAFAQSTKQKQWVGEIKALQKELRTIGERIINLVDRLVDASGSSKREELEGAINKLLMSFESKLYRIDDFLDGNVQKANLVAVRLQLLEAERARKRAIMLLGWSAVICLLIGAETALLVYRRRLKERERREELVRRMIRIEEEERKNLSLQVHDQMGQDLSGLRIYLDLIDKKLPQEAQEAKKDIEEGKGILSDLIERSHNIAELLRPPELEEVGLVDTIESLILQYRHISGIEITYQKPKESPRLSGEYSLLLYRVTQEGLTNVVKHAYAKNVWVELELKNRVVQLSIRDDGRGFDYKSLLQQPRLRRTDRLKLGFLGLKERVELLGGSMHIETAPGEGTRLTVQIPSTKT